MGYVSLVPLIDILPATLADGPVEPLSDAATAATFAPGSLFIVGEGWHLHARTAHDGLVWDHVVVTVVPGVTSQGLERLNRVLKGSGFPKVETDWRTKQPAILSPGRRVGLPARMVGNLNGDGVLRPSSLMVTPLVTPAGGPTAVVAPPPPALVAAPPAPVAAPPVSIAPPVVAVTAAPTPTAPSPEAWGWAKPAPKRAVSPTPAAAPVPAPLHAERLEPVADGLGIFSWPTVATGIVTGPDTWPNLDRLWAMHIAGDRQVVALIGPAGTGKTTLAYDLAVKVGVPIAKVDGAGAITFADWVGYVGAREQNGATVTGWNPSAFIQAMRADGPMGGKHRIVVIDEVNRAESSSATNALLPMLDDTGSLYIPDALRAVPVDPTVFVVVTANMGAAHTGTVALDVALTDRVTHWEEMGYPKQADEVALVVARTGLDEKSAERLVLAATAVRMSAERGEVITGIGPRKVLQAARKVKGGFTLVGAANSTWTLAYSADGGERNTVRSAIEGFLR